MTPERELEIRRLYRPEGGRSYYWYGNAVADLLAALDQARATRDELLESEREWQRRGDRVIKAEAERDQARAELAHARDMCARPSGVCLKATATKMDGPG